MILYTLLFAAFAQTAPTAERLPVLTWDWDTPRRYLAETQVRLPSFLWMWAGNNTEVRVIGFQMQAVLACRATGDRRRRTTRIGCTIEDVSLMLGPLPGDRGRTQPILDEYTEVMRGSALLLDIHDDGRIMAVDNDIPIGRNQRFRTRNETIRLLTRYLANGLEVHVNAEGQSRWVSGASMLCTMPTARGTIAPVQGVHHGVQRDGFVETASQQRGTMSGAGGPGLYTCATTSRAFFEPGSGVLKHTWEMIGEPTASNPIAIGAAGYPYIQRGAMHRLGEDESVTLEPSAELEVSPNKSNTAIQQGQDAVIE